MPEQLAMVLGNLGKYEDANTYYVQAADGMRRQLGENHPEVATAYSNLALNLQELDRLTESLDLSRKGPRDRVFGTVGPGSPKMRRCGITSDMVLDGLGRHPEARFQYEKALAVVLRSRWRNESSDDPNPNQLGRERIARWRISRRRRPASGGSWKLAARYFHLTTLRSPPTR